MAAAAPAVPAVVASRNSAQPQSPAPANSTSTMSATKTGSMARESTERPTARRGRARPRVGGVDRSLLVKLTAGAEAPERANQAFTVAATGLTAGVRVSLWLTGEASWYGVPGRAEESELLHATPLCVLRDSVIAGGLLTVCTQCAARRDIGEDDLLPGVRIAGSATFVEEALAEGTQALVY